MVMLYVRIVELDVTWLTTDSLEAKVLKLFRSLDSSNVRASENDNKNYFAFYRRKPRKVGWRERDYRCPHEIFGRLQTSMCCEFLRLARAQSMWSNGVVTGREHLDGDNAIRRRLMHRST